MDDEIGQDLERTLRTAITAAAQLLEQLFRRQRDKARAVAQANRERAAELEREMVAQREVARATYSRVNDERWWQSAEPAEVAQVWATAEAWREFDARAGAVADHLREQIQARWGIDVAELGAAELAAQRRRELEAVEAEQRDRTTSSGDADSAKVEDEVQDAEHRADVAADAAEKARLDAAASADATKSVQGGTELATDTAPVKPTAIDAAQAKSANRPRDRGLHADELPLNLSEASAEARAAAAPGFPRGAHDILAQGGPRSKKIKPRKINRGKGKDNELGR
jgi:hypothetical protein